MISADESDSLDDESDDDGSDYGSAGICTFTFLFEDSVGCVDNSVGRVDDYFGPVCGVGSGIFVPIGIESNGDVVPLIMLVLI